MGTHFIKVNFGLNVHRKHLFVPKDREKLYLNIFKRKRFLVLKESHFSGEDCAGSQIHEISQALEELSTSLTDDQHSLMTKKCTLYEVETTTSLPAKWTVQPPMAAEAMTGAPGTPRVIKLTGRVRPV